MAVVEQGLTSHQTHYTSRRSYRGRNCVKALKEDGFYGLGFNPIRSTPPESACVFNDYKTTQNNSSHKCTHGRWTGKKDKQYYTPLSEHRWGAHVPVIDLKPVAGYITKTVLCACLACCQTYSHFPSSECPMPFQIVLIHTTVITDFHKLCNRVCVLH